MMQSASYAPQLHLHPSLPDVSHNQMNQFLRTRQLPANQLREQVLPLLDDSPAAFLLVDDSVQDKRYSRFIAVAKRPYSGAVHGLPQSADQSGA